MAIVYVLNKDGKPLMPTTRCGHVRWLLKVGQARIMPGAVFRTGGAYKVSVSSTGLRNGKPQYYIFADGTRSTPRNCTNVLQNTGLVFV